jgi:hypothetical protein
VGLYSMRTGKVSTGALGAGGTKSFILLNPVTDKGRLCEIWLSFGATADQVDVAWELYRTTTLGSPGVTAGTVVKYDPNDEASAWTGLVDLSVEPTAVEVLIGGYLTLNKGLLVVQYPLGREPVGVGGGARIGLRVVNDGTGAMTAVNGRMGMVWEK